MAEIPASPRLDDLINDYQGLEGAPEGEAFVATPDNIEQHTKRLTLRPGLKVALLSKPAPGAAVKACLRFHFGTEKALAGHAAALELVPAMLMRGTTDRDHQELRDEIDRLQCRIDVTGVLGTLYASIWSDRTHFIKALGLLAEIVQRPAFSVSELEILLKEQLASLEQGLSDPGWLGAIARQRAMNPWPVDSVHYVPTLEERMERLKGVTPEVLKELHAQYYGASNVEIAVVGDFDAEEVRATLTELFGSWESPAPYERIGKPYRPIKAACEKILVRGNPQAHVAMGIVFPMCQDDPDYPAMRLAGRILGPDPTGRLMSRLRNKEGLSYGVFASVSVPVRDQKGSLTAAFLTAGASCASQDATKALSAMREEIGRWIAEGVTEEELHQGKERMALMFEESLAYDLTLAGLLADGLEWDRTLQFEVELLEKIERLTTADVQRVLEKRLGGLPFIEVITGDLEQEQE
ncbi:MAG: pitrilysin family protein [Planctomycetota bacterium]